MSFHPQTQSENILLLTSSPDSDPSPHFPCRFSCFSRACLAAAFQILILQTFNFATVEMSKKVLVRMKEHER